MTKSPCFEFLTLTPDLILNAIESTGIYVSSGLTTLNSYENRVYQFMDEQRQRYVVKFYRPQRWNSAQIQEEHDFTLELAETGIDVVPPLCFSGQTLFSYQDYLFALYPSIGGRSFEADNLDQLEQVGSQLGRLHAIGKKRPFCQRLTINLQRWVYDPQDVLQNSPLIPKKHTIPLLNSLQNLIKQIETHWPEEQNLMRLHGDCHAGNILWRDQPFFVDFDDCCNGMAIQDLWLLLYGDKNEQAIQLDTLLSAYNEYNDFPLSELNYIEPLRAMRMIHYLGWLVNRWGDPAFPKAFPWLKDEIFWYNQQQLFEQQSIAINQPAIRLSPMY